jgi:hypothetical protein
MKERLVMVGSVLGLDVAVNVPATPHTVRVDVERILNPTGRVILTRTCVPGFTMAGVDTNPELSREYSPLEIVKLVPVTNPVRSIGPVVSVVPG